MSYASDSIAPEKLSMAVQTRSACYSMGEHTLSVPASLFSLNRKRLLGLLQADSNISRSSIVLLQGGKEETRYCSDVGPVFRQSSYFHWTFGVTEADCFGAIRISDGASILFFPRLSEEDAIWVGRVPALESYSKRYEVDNVYYVDQMEEKLKEMNPSALLTLSCFKGCCKPKFEGISQFKVDSDSLHPKIEECRVIKTDLEVQVIRYACEISSLSHIQVMKRVSPGMKEYQCEALFQYCCYYYGGCRHCSYTSVCGSAETTAILHYGHAGAPNDKTINDGDICSFDMGAEYYGYSSDVTCSFPANGKFTEHQKVIYNAVLNASRATLEAIKPGVNWVHISAIASQTMLSGLLDYGILQGDIEEMIQAKLRDTFQPYPLGHFLGCDVHDVGGYLDGDPGTENGRRQPITLKTGMVLAIEPGCYFIDYCLNKAKANTNLNRFLVPEKIEQFRNFGGLRIEDVVLVTDDGATLLSNVPRTVEEIEAIMASG